MVPEADFQAAQDEIKHLRAKMAAHWDSRETIDELRAENARYRAALLRIWVGDTGPAESVAQFAYQAVHPQIAPATDENCNDGGTDAPRTA